MSRGYIATLLRDTFDYDKGTVFEVYESDGAWELYYKGIKAYYFTVNEDRKRHFKLERNPESAIDMTCEKCGCHKFIPDTKTTWQPHGENYKSIFFTSTFMCLECGTLHQKTIEDTIKVFCG